MKKKKLSLFILGISLLIFSANYIILNCIVKPSVNIRNQDISEFVDRYDREIDNENLAPWCKEYQISLLYFYEICASPTFHPRSGRPTSFYVIYLPPVSYFGSFFFHPEDRILYPSSSEIVAIWHRDERANFLEWLNE